MNRNPDVGRSQEWDDDLEAFVHLMQASFVLLQPSADFQGGLRERLIRAATEFSAQPKKAQIPRAVLVGAAAALSLVGAAGAGAAWWIWKTRPQHNPVAALAQGN